MLGATALVRYTRTKPTTLGIGISPSYSRWKLVPRVVRRARFGVAPGSSRFASMQACKGTDGSGRRLASQAGSCWKPASVLEKTACLVRPPIRRAASNLALPMPMMSVDAPCSAVRPASRYCWRSHAAIAVNADWFLLKPTDEKLGSPALPVLSLRCYAAWRTRARRSWNPARPYIVRLMVLMRLIWPSAGLVVHGRSRAACTAARSRRRPAAKSASSV